MAISIEALRRKISAYVAPVRPQLVEVLRAHGYPESDADRVLEAIAREWAPKLIESVRERLRESPAALGIVLGRDPLPTERSAKLEEVSRRKAEQREWVEQALARLTADDFEIGRT